MNDQQKRLDTIQQGGQATLISGIVSPYVNHRITNTVQRMAAAYRSGQVDYPTLLGAVAQITCLLDMMADLESKQRQGVLATDKERGDVSKSA